MRWAFVVLAFVCCSWALVDVDDCASGPCANGATCLDLEFEYICICPRGFYGLTCANDKDECCADPCQNGGTCLNQPGNYTCLCPPGFTNSSSCDTQLLDNIGSAPSNTTSPDEINWFGAASSAASGALYAAAAVSAIAGVASAAVGASASVAGGVASVASAPSGLSGFVGATPAAVAGGGRSYWDAPEL